MHNKDRLKYFKPSENTFEGKMSCGGTCYLLNFYLKKNGIETSFVRRQIGYGKYLEDHCFLLYNNKYIIDPTYRQMFSGYGHNNDKYLHYLFHDLPFVFVGTNNELVKIYYKLSNLYEKKHNISLSNENLIFWNNYKNENYKLDLKLVINNYNYAS